MSVNEVSWAPRATQRSIKRLYENEASGLLDAEIVDDVGLTLLLRCESILQVDRAVRCGIISCPRCQHGKQTEFRRGEDDLQCPECGWAATWKDYWRTFKGQQLNAGGAGAFFREYTETYPRARSPKEKVLIIDRLIHAFHFNTGGLPSRAACANLIEGKLSTVIQFLDRLSAGEDQSELRKTRAEWRESVAAIRTRNAKGSSG